MAFELYNWSEVSSSLNQGLVSAAIATPSSDTVTSQGSQNIFSYYSATDTLATILAADYFLAVAAYQLFVGDWILVEATDGNAIIGVTNITFPTTVSAPTGITTTQIFAGSSEYFVTGITAANLITAYTTPLLLVPAPGAGLYYVVESVAYDFTYGSAAFTGGGVMAVQYGNTTHGGGVLATTGIAAASVTGVSADWVLTDTDTQVNGSKANVVNAGLYLSNQTAAFAVGTGTTFTIRMRYHTLTF